MFSKVSGRFRHSLQQMTLASTKQVQQIAEKGLAICPENPSLYRLLVSAYINYYWFDTTRSPQESINKSNPSSCRQYFP